MTPTLAVTGSNLCNDAPFSVALELDGAVTSAAVPAGERGDLARLCDELCRARGLQPAQLRRVVLDVGPGSYTGLRVAVTFVRLLQQFGDIQVEGVCSLAALARLAVQGDAGRVRTVLDARRGRPPHRVQARLPPDAPPPSQCARAGYPRWHAAAQISP